MSRSALIEFSLMPNSVAAHDSEIDAASRFAFEGEIDTLIDYLAQIALNQAIVEVQSVG